MPATNISGDVESVSARRNYGAMDRATRAGRETYCWTTRLDRLVVERTVHIGIRFMVRFINSKHTLLAIACRYRPSCRKSNQDQTGTSSGKGRGRVLIGCIVITVIRLSRCAVFVETWFW